MLCAFVSASASMVLAPTRVADTTFNRFLKPCAVRSYATKGYQIQASKEHLLLS